MHWLARRLLSHTHLRAFVLVIAVGVLLCLSSLWAPMMADDFTQARKLNPDFWGAVLPFGRPGVMGLFDFVSPSSGGAEALIAEGYLGWWTSPDVKLSFWRPISALTHLLDHRLWPDRLVAIRLHGLAWQVGLYAAVAVVLRRFMRPREALLALALYCWDDARGMTLGFLANRNALLAGGFGFLAVMSHHRWRQGGSSRFALVSCLCLGLSLLSAELGLSTTAWLFAYALFVDPTSRWARLRSLVPAVAVCLCWMLVYRALDFGTAASGVYVHPLHGPLLFAEKLVPRMSWYALGQLGFVPADIVSALPPSLVWLGCGLGLLLTAGLIALVWPLLRARAEARFFALGSLLSLLPICGTFCSDRNLTFVSLGASALLAMWLVSVLDGPAVRWKTWVFRGICLLHLGWAALLLPLRCLTSLGADAVLPALYAPVADDPQLAEKTAVYVWVSSDAWPGFGRLQAVGKHQVVPRRALPLVCSEGRAAVTRVDDRTLRIEVTGFLARESMQMVRGPDQPFEVGFTKVLPDARVTVEAVDAQGRPTTIQVRFNASIDDPRYTWQSEHWGSFPVWTPPAVGETVWVGEMFG